VARMVKYIKGRVFMSVRGESRRRRVNAFYFSQTYTNATTKNY